MKTEIIRQTIFAIKPPMNFYTSDGRVIYIDHPESVLISEALVAVASGLDEDTGLAKEILLIAPDHIVRIDPANRRALRKVA
jgi:hypothetical protein